MKIDKKTLLKLIGKMALVFAIWAIGTFLMLGKGLDLAEGIWLIAFIVVEVLIVRGRLWG